MNLNQLATDGLVRPASPNTDFYIITSDCAKYKLKNFQQIELGTYVLAVIIYIHLRS